MEGKYMAEENKILQGEFIDIRLEDYNILKPLLTEQGMTIDNEDMDYADVYGILALCLQLEVPREKIILTAPMEKTKGLRDLSKEMPYEMTVDQLGITYVVKNPPEESTE